VKTRKKTVPHKNSDDLPCCRRTAMMLKLQISSNRAGLRIVALGVDSGKTARRHLQEKINQMCGQIML
jgi:hypothetical protein